jgi:N-ethylmaleimide reductase
MLGGGMDHDTSEELIRTKQIDMASFGRLYIANPDLPMRFMRNLALNEFDPSTFYVGGEKGYIDYAAAVE